jgi:O-acetyl-ADP-ribose deacetylase (regulator of RNase III)
MASSPLERIRIITGGNIFQSECQCITNPTNSIGVMGGGLAAAFMSRYGLECEAYNRRCIKAQMNGLVLLAPELVKTEGDRYLLMFPTKIHFRNPSQYEYLQTNLPKAFDTLEKAGIHSVAFPKLGAGLGGLDPGVVVNLIGQAASQHFKGVNCEIYV